MTKKIDEVIRFQVPPDLDQIEDARLRNELLRIETEVSKYLGDAPLRAHDGEEIVSVPLSGLDPPGWAPGHVELVLHARYAEDGGGYHFTVWYGNGEHPMNWGGRGATAKELRPLCRAMPEMIQKVVALIRAA